MNILDIHQVSKIYGSGHTAVKAVDKVDFHLKSGEIVLIMGPSGSGKTTLLTMAGALLRPTSGQIEIMEQDIYNLSAHELAALRLKTIGFIFQTFNLFSSLTAQENVELVLNLAGVKGKKATIKSLELLQKLGLEKRTHHLPVALSGGEKQRVAIARALACDPKLILADEPTGNLDSQTGHDVVMLLYEIAKEQGRSVVIVSHDQRLMDVATRVLWLEDGRLSERPKEKKEMVKDPVCGMQIIKNEAAFVFHYEGKSYYFCSQKCKGKFEKEPKKFLLSDRVLES